ncbi:type 1 glutamine amidotransferase [Sulfitobacter sp. M57]|uniref:type 1 glutamine amidotransferase n=1 Tax=unclassified Sulfitobacter TaxID=196795 RepID=UPI0023E0B5DE|nr:MULTISPECIES: type 1 glutamine amidotransferase [unclassified Sulfitobacter]MDF3416084.1 type 1 glutamine amidotransferase [Sulfitobacter sp. KE5]MDF3423563.1 type 1 glutamine amidotransferase [Sulfitobacter sp. KE43]MDF3434635.1 type 1 glutamine amidotransferase [Sulfitobacter sp. KE42]MDF3460269.1 type 1 glutamine amidotransferase [Sulfitobacter sp. S74]MDF3464173.1 type 1 glutamine amidotransferase [Sulfitobacter sp. Ks18]
MKIGILQTGRTPNEIREANGDYDDMFKSLLAGRGFTFETYPVLDGVFPASVNKADGWLVTGSKFGVYEDHDWIAPLENFLRQAFAAEVPIVGVCFGHQILAQALGGKVEKFSGGWQVGATDYQRADGTKECIIAWHQDQVTELPEGAEVLGASEHCAYAMVSYGNRALTVQPHPEFTGPFMADLLGARGDILPDNILSGAQDRIGDTLTSLDYAQRFEDFFKASSL